MDLQYCPQRNVPSISKQKMFVSTVSKYDPRTKRTTRLQNCVPYDQLIAKDRSVCHPPLAECVPPVIIPNVSITFNNPYPISFSFTPIGTGTVYYGDGIPVLFSNNSATLTGTVPDYGTVTIFSDFLTGLTVSGQRITHMDVSNAPILSTLDVSNNLLTGIFDVSHNTLLTTFRIQTNLVTGISGLSYCPLIHTISAHHNLITQTSANSIATNIYTTGSRSGTMAILTQSNGTLSSSTPAFTNLITGRSWTVT